MSDQPILGSVDFPSEWTIFAPWPVSAPVPDTDSLKTVPEALTIEGVTHAAVQVKPTRQQFDFRGFIGEPPYADSQAVYVYLPINSEMDQEVTLGFGADWFLQVWMDGEALFDTLENGNISSPPTIDDFRIQVQLSAGSHVLVVRLLNGKAYSLLASGGPEELRTADRTSLMPPKPKLDVAALYDRYPPDPDAPIHWKVPAGFQPEAPDLGLPHLKEAEHVELLHCKKSTAPLDEGGAGVYESLEHGTWNHNIGIAVFRDRLIGIWDNHSLDENGPGSRVMGRIGKVIDEEGRVDWEIPGSLVELAPQPVPIRRRKVHCDTDKIRPIQAKARFCVIQDRLILCGHLGSLFGVSSDPLGSLWAGLRDSDRILASEHFHFGPTPDAMNGGFIHWDLGFKFYQEWDVRDDRLQPVSPIYKENEMPTHKRLTPDLILPLEPVLPPYSDAPLLADAPEDFQQLIASEERRGFMPNPLYAPGTRRLAHDGINGLAHFSEFQRPDGSWVVLRENQQPRTQPVYYAAEKTDPDACYPPARRTNVFGSVKPASGQLPDGRVFIVGNTVNRRTMFITISEDGREFSGTRFIRHEMLKDYTPGIMKRQGGPGAGPQYFMPAVVGQSLWVVYSISKEHVAATRIPVSALTVD